MYKIMVIEDNNKIRNELCDFLKKNGYDTITTSTFDNLIAFIIQRNPDLLLLDLNLPGIDGFYICKELRKQSNMPIIVVTSRNSDIDELMSMNVGADDFITKPYHSQILLARIASICKRVYETNNTNCITVQNVILDLSKSNLSYHHQTIDLTRNEQRIIHCLFLKKDQIVSRTQLMEYMWEGELFVDDNTLTVNINRLRKKLETLGLQDFIQTKRGMGYIIYEA